MTKLNKNMLERGGLMIEALAMLGLIAVVTPTMYKKSAERTLEVEDINTATTVRTYMNAVEAFMNNEYGTLMGQPELNADGGVADPNARRGFFYESADDVTIGRPIGSRDFHGNAGDPVLELTVDDLEPYLPYHFEANNPLYDYAAPQARIVKNGNNLTAFVQFPARQGQADGIGQERTARIASLVGATGGYVLSDGQQARGVGGVWSLDNNNMNALFGGAGNPYSLVTASANVAMDTNGGQLDNDKYLQRTREDDTDAEGDELWRNTMRTDLYMGGNLNEDSNETQNTNGQDNNTKHSIRSIQSMIVGAEKAPEVGRQNADGTPVNDAEGHQVMDEVTNYGLYIYGTGTDNKDYADAYINGALQAVANELYASKGRMIGEGDAPAEGSPDERYGGAQFLFGRESDSEYNTEIRGNGDIMNMGSQGWIYANLMNENEQNSVTIGGEYGIAMDYTPTGETSTENVLDIAIGNTVLIGEHGKKTDGSNPSNIEASYVSIFSNDQGFPWGYRTMTNDAGVEEQIADDRSVIAEMYNTEPNFPVALGANTKVEGTLAAAQLDVNKIRAASISVGSKHVDDPVKWMTVDADGVHITDPHDFNGTDTSYSSEDGPGMEIRHQGIRMVVDDEDFTQTDASKLKGTGGGAVFTMSGWDGGSNAEIELATQDTNPTRLRVTDGSVDVVFDEGYENYNGNQSDKKAVLSTHSESDNNITITARENVEKAGDLTIEANKGQYGSGDSESPSQLKIRNSEVSIDMLGNDLVIQQAANSRRAAHVNDADHDHTAWANNEFRTIFQGGHVNLNNANLKVYNTTVKGGLSVRGNNDVDSGGDSSVGKINDSYVDGEDAKYITAVHGATVFTGAGAEKVGTNSDGSATTKDRSGLKFASIGQYDEGATLNIVADKDATTVSNQYNSVLVLDSGGIGKTDNSTGSAYNMRSGAKITENADGTKKYEERGEGFAFRDGSADKDIMNGTIYMRRGMLEIMPDAYQSGYSADQGAGIVKAGRFVANNLDSNGDLVQVPVLVDDVAGTYEASDYKRYDTYMVNPAYTSVMHDIKLTTRGGARLSDILPDFINKGIYVANNTIKENANNRKMEFTLGSGLTVTGFTSEASVDEAVSPYMGAVPAPQCPPGYGRVITVSPVSFEMAQAGTPKLTNMNGTSTFYAAADDPLPAKMKTGTAGDYSTTSGDSGLIDEKDNSAGDDGGVMSPSHELKYRELEWDPSNVVITANVSGGADTSEANKTIKDISYSSTGVVDISTMASGKDAEGHARRVKAYVLATATNNTDNTFKPLTFQQSTFLKTAAVPLVQGCTTQFGDGQSQITTKCGEGSYVRAWGVLMGFIYPEKYYKTIINTLQPGIFADHGGTETFYWNIFPVLRDHLEAYATVYCYYDRTDLYEHNASTGIAHVDPYDHLHNPPASYMKQQTSTQQQQYIKRLNDPALKYNETW